MEPDDKNRRNKSTGVILSRFTFRCNSALGVDCARFNSKNDYYEQYYTVRSSSKIISSHKKSVEKPKCRKYPTFYFENMTRFCLQFR